ncbi:variant erythrocyte surface antigen-1 beta subunit [Babesia bovis T2Bo]|uniref:variant erythrocyte surface antigen-1 beta subunit n=1 Tax=Babesia bovis T2Bo TaxID=484906 RepID=UPI001C367F1C|nr:variant erythrocyte surface antigen-1 beta subunit [Babesia bovis T2Bo]EDO05216.2 variant erythrocyte surface antigen-1 beta subunit [Babesia bovis T2Bo]
MSQNTWTPYNSLTQAPTNLKEAIDWVLRVTGRDGKKNVKPAAPKAPANSEYGPHCLCFLAKAVKDLLYDARSPESPGPSPKRNWDDILLTEEQSIVHPVLTDLGLLSGGSTGAARDTCAGGTEVIKALIDQLAEGLQKWVGWQEEDQDGCCLKGTDGIGKKCTCSGGGGTCCSAGGSGTTCHECSQCGTSDSAATKCYQSAYKKEKALWTDLVNGTPGGGGSGSAGSASTVNTVQAAQDVHLLARIFLGSVCLIWSGLSHLGFLTGNGSGAETRWSQGELSKEATNLGSFMAAMGYDLERLNQGSGGKYCLGYSY